MKQFFVEGIIILSVVVPLYVILFWIGGEFSR
jgi:hypothetical protein